MTRYKVCKLPMSSLVNCKLVSWVPSFLFPRLKQIGKIYQIFTIKLGSGLKHFVTSNIILKDT